MVPAGALSLSQVRFLHGIRPWLLLAASAIVLLCRLQASPEQYENKPIARIEFEPSDQPLPLAELDRLLPLRKGQPLHIADVETAIQRLFSTGRYADISVDASLEGDAVLLRFLTASNYFVGRVNVSGAPDPPHEGELAAATKFELGTLYSGSDLPQAIDNINLQLRLNGLYQASVKADAGRDPATAQMNLDFRVDPGKRARFDGVALSGDVGNSPGGVVRATHWQRFYGLFGDRFGWEGVTESRVQSGLHNLRLYYQKNDRLLAKVTLEKLDYHSATNRVTANVHIDLGPRILVRAQGARISRSRLRQLIPVYQEQSVDQSLLVEGKRNLLEYFQSQGYFDAKVDFEQKPEQGGQQIIEYTIHRELRHKLVHLEIAGNRYFDTGTIRERMLLTPAAFIRYHHGRYSQTLLNKDVDAIEALYRSNGFRNVEVAPKIEKGYRGKPGDLGVLFQVREGAQWLVAKLDIEGASEQDKAHLASILHSAAGEPFSEFNIASDSDGVLGYYFNNGYPDATFDWSETPSALPNQVNLRFEIHPGERHFVRSVLIDGLEDTNPNLVKPRIRIGPGDPLSEGLITESQRQLYDLGIFSKVQTAIQNPTGNEEDKAVIFSLVEARKYSLTGGFGAEIARIGGSLSSFDAPAGATGFSPRVTFGISRLNFLGLGHTVSMQSRLSTYDKRLVLSYFAPQFQGHENLNLTFSGLYDNSHDVRTFASQRSEASVQLGQKFSRSFTLQYRFTARDVTVNDIKITPELIPLLSQPVRVGVSSVSLIQDRRDDPTDAHKGIYNTIDAAVAIPVFGAKTSFGRLLARNATYHPFGKDLVFARSTSFGLIRRLSGPNEIPLPERFFAGGVYSNRAFPDNQAGPRDLTTGFPLGGTALLMNSFELRFPLIGDNISGVLFHDAGNVYDNVGDISFRFRQRNLEDFNYMVHAFGFGIRYRTPVGPVRLDLALSPNAPRFVGFRGTIDQLLACTAPGAANPCAPVPQRISIFQFHFSLGQAF